MERLTRLTIIILLAIATTVFQDGSVLSQQKSESHQVSYYIDAPRRAHLIESILKRLNDSYVFPQTAHAIERSLRERMRNREYEGITSATDFARVLTEHLQAVSRDKHLHLRYSAEPLPLREERREPTAEERENFRRFAIRNNHGFERVERLQGNIGYLELCGFLDPELGAETVAAAMTFLSNTDALIIDLRRNRGGSPEMVALISSYLLGETPVHLNDLYWREGDRTEEFWTKRSIPGKRYIDKSVYVLTSKDTFSAGEEFAYNLKNLKRATIIGERTAGGAHPGRGFRIDEHFELFVPIGRAINPITKQNWEGTGLKPDVDVPSERALKTAHLAALKKVMEKSVADKVKSELRRTIEMLDKEYDELKKPASNP